MTGSAAGKRTELEMDDGSQGNAMTEVALALAMGFFSLLVLTMVSMGAGEFSSDTKLTLVLTPSASQDSRQGATPFDPDNQLVIYHRGRFFDASLEPLDPLSIDATKRVILAFAPDIPVSEAMKARSRISAGDILVSTLDEDWQAALGRVGNAEGAAR